MDAKREQFFAGHMKDLADRADQGGYPVFTDFLTTGEYALLHRMHRQFSYVKNHFFGGHEDCSHVVGGFFPLDWPDIRPESFPIRCLRIFPENERYAQELGHRDYLGAILNLGMERAKIGDIRISGLGAFVFCKEEFASFIQENLRQVKRTSVACTPVLSQEEIPPQQYEELNRSVASLRLDNIVAAASGRSRSVAAQLIAQGHVVAGDEERTSVSYSCTDGMILTIRGYGKYRLHVSEESYTRKGKLKITIYKYI